MSKDFPYVLPGPDNEWGGTSWTVGLRTHEQNILFALKDTKTRRGACLVVDLAGVDSKGGVLELVMSDKPCKAWR